MHECLVKVDADQPWSNQYISPMFLFFSYTSVLLVANHIHSELVLVKDIIEYITETSLYW